MKKLIAKSGNEFCNIDVDKVEKVDDCVFAFRNGEFVGMFSLGCLDMIYVSEQKP